MVTEIRDRPVMSASGGKGFSLSHVTSIPADGWPPRPFQIVSFWDMQKFNAHVFFAVANSLWLDQFKKGRLFQSRS
jgi:hypothetical protein